ncbi:MAG: SIR2 family protein [Pseudomonadota bacterium]
MASSSFYGYLGLFVGSGFSKAATLNRAPTFKDLLTRLANEFGLNNDFSRQPYEHQSFPQIASTLLRQLSTTHPFDAELIFRQRIADLCNFIPDPSIQASLSTALEGIAPSWVITTNYDLILEALLERGQTLRPDQVLVARPDRVPIYHMHGHRHTPLSIRISEEDYVALLTPFDYQRLKLPLLLLESSTLMLGYSAGDINVRSAIEWSRSFTNTKHFLQNIVVQALWVPGPPNPLPYLGRHGEHIIEINDILPFLQELCVVRANTQRQIADTENSIHGFLSNQTVASTVFTDANMRSYFLGIIQYAIGAVSTILIAFIDGALDPVWTLATQPQNFGYYDTYLTILLNILSNMTISSNPRLLWHLAACLDKVGPYIDPAKTPGQRMPPRKRG